jgi:2-dehydropantoate 2-reductase
MSEAPSSSRAKLSVAVIGLGGIGSTFAYQLARAGHDVTAIARPGSLRLQQLRRDQGVLSASGERAALRVEDHLDEALPYDLVVVTTLSHQVGAVLPALQRSQARCVHFMFNIFDPERLQAAIGEHRCTFGMPFVMATLDTDGRLHSTITRSRKTLHSDERWVELFNSAGIPSALEANIRLWLRCHVPMCIAFESISVAAQRRGGGASWTEAMTVARGVHGGFAIIQGLGCRLYPASKVVIKSSPAVLLAALLWFVSRIASFRDLLATGLNECRALVDDLVSAADGEVETDLRPHINAVRAMKPAAEGPNGRVGE